ncbi:hypothetical protein [Dyella choica]|uniref:YscQ/HrcQ family type III secretion apparatus protein n=1 Tax=Dyella choica TaxID=1927959 RepID=A0A432MA33_9GAMM|nr:hypothetical protein [Dyella choica]RUL79064.1 hypothetical protein EKH80_04505 [Dyella choica]
MTMDRGQAVGEAGEALSEAARALLARGNVLKDQSALELRAGVGQRHAATLACVCLDGAQGRLLVALEREQIANPLGDAQWQDYTGDARLLAWSLAHEPMLDALGRVFGGGFVASRFMAAGSPDACLWLALSWHGEHGQSLQGWLGLGVAETRLLSACADWKRDPSKLSMLGDAAVLTFELMLQGRAVNPETAAQLMPGDVLLVSEGADCDACLQPDRETLHSMFGLPAGWMVQRRHGQWTIAARPLSSTAIDPHRPRFRLAQLSLSPEQVGALQAGSVLSYDSSLLGNAVDILFGEHRYGEGVIVALGEWLGVRVSHHGNSQKGTICGFQ